MKSRTILVLKSTLQQCGKNIITDFIGDKVLGSYLHFATSDLEKILGRFNSAIQARKLIVMNETGMSNGKWHRFNGHLKLLITERMVAIERKSLETVRINDYAGYMVTSNQDAPFKIDIGDSRIVYFEVSSHCRGNISYFDQLGEILEHSDTPEVVITYLLSRNLTNWSPGKIPATKMKEEIMRDQLLNPVRFLINYIASWDEGKIVKPKHKSLYQTYLEWCGENGEKPFSDSNLRKKFAFYGINRIRLQTDGKKEYHYIFDCSKIIAKLRKSGLGDMEEFSDILQDELPANEATDILIFNVPETGPQKIIPPQPEKSTPSANTSKDRKADKQDESSQALFDYVAEDTHAISLESAPVASTSGTSETSEPPESVVDKPKTAKLPDSPKPNEVSSAILLSRAQREERLRKRAVELGKDPDKFVTITEKDKYDSPTFQDRMEMDSRMCSWAIEMEDDPKEDMDMTVRKRLIGKEIICRRLEEKGITSSWLDTNEKWKKTISILQENGMLW